MKSKLSILVAHNTYQQKGGEDSVANTEISLLRANGHRVTTYLKDNSAIDGMSAVSLAGQTLWSRKTETELLAMLEVARPDVIHAHNTFPLISPSLYWAASNRKIPVVQTLHNFRLICPQAMLLRESKVCEDCLGHIPWRSVVHGCYRGSRAQTAVVASMLVFHRSINTWQKKVTRYIALNEFCRQKFIEGGLPAHRIVVKPNFVDFKLPHDSTRSGMLFVGRLSAEKGVQTLATAAKLVMDVDLRVAGTGSGEDILSVLPNVQLLGALSGDGVALEMSKAMALVLPSIWYENFPRTLVEGFASGLPVIASRIGALAELVQDGVTGLLFESGNAADLADKMRWARDNPDKMLEMGKNARKYYEAKLGAEENYKQLISIYQSAIDELKNGSAIE